jgi:hypothetical protein
LAAATLATLPLFTAATPAPTDLSGPHRVPAALHSIDPLAGPHWAYAYGLEGEEALLFGVAGAIECFFFGPVGGLACSITGAL